MGWSGGAYSCVSSIQQVNSGITFEITPLIHSDGRVAMDFRLTTESVSGSTKIANVGDVPITGRTESKAKIAANNKETVVFGGLIQTVVITNSSGVPLLKNIPVVGSLFRHSSVRDTRHELIVLIRPIILSRAQTRSTPTVRVL